MTADAGRRAAYEPPKQSVRGQLLDAFVVLALIFVTLFGTTYLVESQDSGGGAARPLAELPLTPGEREQYQKMIDTGVADLETISAGVEANQAGADKYDIDVLALLGTAVLLALYLGFVYRVSFREYREVVEEKFGAGDVGDDSGRQS
ncbi:hypothetical protein [Actinomycetospora chibensis]|uniref:Uncharacterized protein n=1 Tax=Actinomycetospora chibensis TaxID=663606 RepID=A0ABV9RHX2_9PSEU|nr:hypothetical protein [Actinomycetospora chibensis]MDD7926668.1 hypothetical protein [Actinomycetospora chibensis]